MRRRTSRTWLLLAATLGGLAFGHGRGAASHRSAEGTAVVPEGSPWASPEACEREVAAGHRSPRDPSVLRVGAWNIRWFPDGNPGRAKTTGEGPLATNVRWLACAVAYLGVDVLALEEIKTSPEAATALSELRTRLDALTGGEHHVEVDRCPASGRQSVALLWNERRVHGDSFRNVDSLNPRGGCDEHLRPGFGGYFRAPGGADFHFIAVHAKSGEEPRDVELRRATLRGIPKAFDDAQATTRDDDVVLAGDFNTMGCLRCSPPVRPREELREFSSTVAALPVPFRDFSPVEGCSEYYRGEGQVLDHVLVSGKMKEVPEGTRAHVAGFCAAVSCGRQDARGMPRAYQELSDHCPVLLDVLNRDTD